MPAEAVSGFVIISAGGIVVEHPAGVLGAAGFVDEPPDLLVVPVPEPADATMLAVLLPEMRVYVSLGVERSHELIAMAGRAGWKFLQSSEMERDALEDVRQYHKIALRSGHSGANGIHGAHRRILDQRTSAIFDLHQDPTTATEHLAGCAR